MMMKELKAFEAHVINWKKYIILAYINKSVPSLL